MIGSLAYFGILRPSRILPERCNFGAEIGCHRGLTTKYLLERNPELRLIAIDLWSMDAYKNTGFEETLKWNFEDNKKAFWDSVRNCSDRVITVQGYSWNVPKWVRPSQLDFVFIDAGHSYGSVYEDVLKSSDKSYRNLIGKQ